jgi:hypothetical protein
MIESSDKLVYDVQIVEEDVLSEHKVWINEVGIIEWDENPKNENTLYEYNNVIPDKTADVCGIWYEGIVLNKKFKEDKDNNCCM